MLDGYHGKSLTVEAKLEVFEENFATSGYQEVEAAHTN